MQRDFAVSLAALLTATTTGGPACAAVATNVLGASMTIEASCTVASGSGVLSVTCATATPYSVSAASRDSGALARVVTTKAALAISDALFPVGGEGGVRPIRKNALAGDGERVEVTVTY